MAQALAWALAVGFFGDWVRRMALASVGVGVGYLALGVGVGFWRWDKPVEQPRRRKLGGLLLPRLARWGCLLLGRRRLRYPSVGLALSWRRLALGLALVLALGLGGFGVGLVFELGVGLGVGLGAGLGAGFGGVGVGTGVIPPFPVSSLWRQSGRALG